MKQAETGQTLKAIRKQQGLTQRELAEKINVVSTTISNWENGWRQPSVYELKRLAAALEVSPSVFMDDKAQLDSTPLEMPSEETRSVVLLDMYVLLKTNDFILIGLALLMWGVAAGVASAFTTWMTLTASLLLIMVFLRAPFRQMHRRNQKKTVPKHHKVQYVHQADINVIESRRHRVLVLGWMGFFTYAFFVGFSIMWLFPLGYWYVTMMLILLALWNLLVMILRHKVLFHPKVFEKKTDASTLIDLSHQPWLYVGFVSVLFGLMLLMVYLASVPLDPDTHLIRIFTVLFGILHSLNALWLYDRYKVHLSGYKPVTVDASGKTYPIE